MLNQSWTGLILGFRTIRLRANHHVIAALLMVLCHVAVFGIARKPTKVPSTTHRWTVTIGSVLHTQVATASSESRAVGPRSATRRCMDGVRRCL
jgi:hypothetical protein